jgi:shikimate kinase
VSARVVLVGLPGVGKTTIGSALADALGVTFEDLDARVADEVGRTPADLLRDGREDELREAECRALPRALATGGVVATGGGTVESPGARALLRDAGTVVWLEAAPETLHARLDGGDRPLVDGSTATRLAALAARRRPLYAEIATTVVDADGPIDDVVARLVVLVGAP